MNKKSFDFSVYMKPMISRMGNIISKQNDTLKQTFVTKTYRSAASILQKRPSTPVEIRINRRLEADYSVKPNTALSKKKSVKASFAFLAKSRSPKDFPMSPSPPPGRYSPHYDFLMRNSPRVFFNKAKLSRGQKSCKIKRRNSESVELPTKNEKIRGISFQKQTKRSQMFKEKAWGHSFEFYNPVSSFEKSDKAHRFESYPRRKPLNRCEEFMPDYNPNYSILYKSNINSLLD